MARRSVVLAALLLATAWTGAHATLPFPSWLEPGGAARFDIAPVRSVFGEEAAVWRVEVGEVALHEVRGLHASGARASGRYRSVLASGSLVHVASTVGAHQRAVFEGGIAIRGSWQGAVRLGLERLVLDGTEATDWRVAGLVSRADVGRVSMLADIDVTAGGGIHETSLRLAMRVRAGAAGLVAGTRIDNDRFAGAAVSVTVRAHRHLALLAGYEDGAESMRAGILVGWSGVEIGAGVSQHPVLGLSQGVSVACAR